MIYFKKIYFVDYDKEYAEKAIRKLALKRNTSLDFKSSGMIAGTDKLFLGCEGENQTQFTRIRYYLENLMPKLIISFPKNDNDQFYKIRLAFRSFIIFSFLSIMLLLVFVLSLTNPNGINVLEGLASFYVIFFLLILLEIKLTKKALHSAIIKLQQTQ
jgi:hypothetical protein